MILVTGGTSGLGLATAKLFAQLGGTVYISGRNRAQGDEAIKKIGKGIVTFIQCDIRKSSEVEKMIAQIVEKSKRLDIAFNNADIFLWHGRNMAQTKKNINNWIVNSNQLGTSLCMEHEIMQMLKNDKQRGTIINRASFAEDQLYLGKSAYIALKTGVEDLTLRESENVQNTQNIRINAIATDFVKKMSNKIWNNENSNTVEQNKNIADVMKNLIEPEDVVVWLASASEKASSVKGQIFAIKKEAQTLKIWFRKKS